MEEMFARTALLLGEEGLEKLKRARVAVFGLGGVGGAAAEALARAGIGALDLIDADRVATSNLNRQIFALRSTVGMLKTEAAERRIKDISPDCVVRRYDCFFLPERAAEFPFAEYDYAVDAIDTLAGKIGIAKACAEAGVPVVSCMGAGNKLDPAAFRVSDIYSTKVCPLARAMRRLCRENGIERLKAVWSREIPMSANIDGENGKRIPGSVSFVPPVVGYIAAGEVVKDIAGVSGNGLDLS